MTPRLIASSAVASAIISLTAPQAAAWGCVRAGGGARAGGVEVYNNGGYGSYADGGCYGAGFAAGGGPAALVGGPQQNPDYVPIPTQAPAPATPPVDPLDDQTIQNGPYSPGVYGRPLQGSGTNP
ncbi:hypothetical protein HQ447_06905 [bacterium]|nr:hypothetical protein [bacterium]